MPNNSYLIPAAWMQIGKIVFIITLVFIASFTTPVFATEEWDEQFQDDIALVHSEIASSPEWFIVATEGPIGGVLESSCVTIPGFSGTYFGHTSEWGMYLWDPVMNEFVEMYQVQEGFDYVECQSGVPRPGAATWTNDSSVPYFDGTFFTDKIAYYHPCNNNLGAGQSGNSFAWCASQRWEARQVAGQFFSLNVDSIECYRDWDQRGYNYGSGTAFIESHP